MVLPVPESAGPDVDAAAAALFGRIDPSLHVGDRHHIVPRFVLSRFANEKGQVFARDRRTGVGSRRNVRDLAVRDYYTFLSTTGAFDGSFETILGGVESDAATILRSNLASSFARAFSMDDKCAIDAFVAFQFVRGPRLRRTNEIVADYGVKFLNQGKLSRADLDELEFVPHQNEHIQLMAKLAEKIVVRLAQRAACIVTLDRPLLVICDEAVLLDPPDDFTYDDEARRDRDRIARSVDAAAEDIVQLRGGTGVGIVDAAAIFMPVGPRHAIIYGSPGVAGDTPHFSLQGADATGFADEVIRLSLDQAVDWVVAHPEHPDFADRVMPPMTPPMAIFDGGTPMSRRLRTDTRRRPYRLRKS